MASLLKNQKVFQRLYVLLAIPNKYANYAKAKRKGCFGKGKDEYVRMGRCKLGNQKTNAPGGMEGGMVMSGSNPIPKEGLRTIEMKMPDNAIIDGPKMEKYTYEEMRTFLDCKMIEIVRLPDNPIMKDAYLVVDEEGKMKNTVHINPTATMIAQICGLQDVIVGSAIICHMDLLFD